MSSLWGISQAGKLIITLHFYLCCRVNLIKSFSFQNACYIPKQLDKVLLNTEKL